MWIVMTSSAHMPASCRGRYRRVALVEVHPYAGETAHAVMPKRIDIRDKAVLRVIDIGSHSVGKTARCAYAIATVEAQGWADELNNAAPAATPDLLTGWGSA